MRAICPSPICGPSRACLASGYEYDRADVRNNGYSASPDAPNVYRQLRNADHYGMKDSYAPPNQVVGRWADGSGWPRRSCVRTGRYRPDMTLGRDGAPVPPEKEDPILADLALDPLQASNRAADPAYSAVLADLRAGLCTHAADSYEPGFVPVFSAAGRGVN